jgi:hypothetical protein
MFVLIAGYLLWTIVSKDPETATLSSVSTASDTSVGDAKVLETLINMRNLRLDDRLFNNPAFLKLINTERKIIPEPVGRRNPFSPIGSDVEFIEQQPAETSTNPQDDIEFGE